MKAGPLLLIGGAALVLLSGKKGGGAGAGAGDHPPPLDADLVPPPPGAPPVTPAPAPKPGTNTWYTRQAWLKHLYALQVCTGCNPGTVDGKPGPNTKNAIMKFQAYAGIFPDGEWGPHTEAAMKRALANPWSMPGAEARLPGYGE